MPPLRTIAAAAFLAAALAADASAQDLAPKRALTIPAGPQCAGVAAASTTRDAAAARAAATR
ncbi:hypothetical protein, partial [Roseisolibacter sp. H3M3-2]|uniref:hypothetical protein n=1 Tax=Roseisolibacter sp. H3M3-2 TaxID=3031323 RepID=UPI0023DA1D97